VCDPIVRYDGGASALAVTSGVLYTAPTDGQRIDAFSMHDANHCTSGTPVVCSPTWTTAAHTDHTTYRRLTTAGGVLYASRARCVSSSCPAGTLLGGIEAFDAAGTVGCHGATVVCDPLLAMPTATVAAEVIVVGGIAYAVGEFSESPDNPAVTVGLGGP
jgi:hypothetical protein